MATKKQKVSPRNRKTKVINLNDVINMEFQGGFYGKMNTAFTMELYNRQPNGSTIKVRCVMPDTYMKYIADGIHKCIKDHEKENKRTIDFIKSGLNPDATTF